VVFDDTSILIMTRPSQDSLYVKKLFFVDVVAFSNNMPVAVTGLTPWLSISEMCMQITGQRFVLFFAERQTVLVQ
jgi:hypothetical protein